jgi:hypothetical protein
LREKLEAWGHLYPRGLLPCPDTLRHVAPVPQREQRREKNELVPSRRCLSLSETQAGDIEVT